MAVVGVPHFQTQNILDGKSPDRIFLYATALECLMKHGYSWTLLQLLKILTHVSFGSQFWTFSATKTVADIACVPSVPHGRPISRDEGLCSVIPTCSICCTFTTHRLRTIGSFPLLFLQTKQWFHPWNSWRPSLFRSTRSSVPISVLCCSCTLASMSKYFTFFPIRRCHSDFARPAVDISHALHFIVVEASKDVNHTDKIMHHLVTNCS